MIRRIIHIDADACNGCGACARACHEGAIEMIGGKAVLTRENYCDGLGDCLPACPTGAITFEEREAPAYDEAAVKAAQAKKNAACSPAGRQAGCPGEAACTLSAASQLRQWPVQLRLVPATAAFFNDADLLIAADCTAYAYARFHDDFIRGRVTLIGCPKLDATDYSEKLTQILATHPIRSITLTRMEVPCCGGLAHAVQTALAASGQDIPLTIVTIAADGRLLTH